PSPAPRARRRRARARAAARTGRRGHAERSRPPGRWPDRWWSRPRRRRGPRPAASEGRAGEVVREGAGQVAEATGVRRADADVVGRGGGDARHRRKPSVRPEGEWSVGEKEAIQSLEVFDVAHAGGGLRDHGIAVEVEPAVRTQVALAHAALARHQELELE